MEHLKKALFLFQFFSYSVQLSQFILHNNTLCPGSDKMPMRFNGSIGAVGFNRFSINAELVVHEVLKAPMEVYSIKLHENSMSNKLLFRFRFKSTQEDVIYI